MKRHIIILIITLFSASLISPVFAQSDKTTDIQAIKARYCNDPNNPQTKSLFIDTETWKPETICIDFINSANQEAIIWINFVDGTITDSSSQSKACLAEWQKENFWQYVSNYPTSVRIPANSTERVTADLLFSGWYAGASYGCLTFFALDEHQDSSWSALTVLARVWSFIDAFVKWDFKFMLLSSLVNPERYNNITNNPNFIIYRMEDRFSQFFTKDFWTYKTKRNVTNNWNIGVNSDLTLTVRSWFIFSKRKTINNQSIYPGQTRTFEYKLPWYMVWLSAWPVRIKWDIEYQWIYLWEAANSAPEQVYSLADKTWHFFIPRVLFILLILAYTCYKRRRKLHRCYRRLRRKLPKIMIVRHSS